MTLEFASLYHYLKQLWFKLWDMRLSSIEEFITFQKITTERIIYLKNSLRKLLLLLSHLL